MDAPGAVYGTILTSINNAGAIAGFYFDAELGHGFVLDRAGAITTFDPINSIYTNPVSISDSGVITGFYEDTSYAFHGFVFRK